MPNFFGCRCCGDNCDLNNCETSASEMGDDEIEFIEMICSSGTPSAIDISSIQDEGIGRPAPSRKVTFSTEGSAGDESYAYALHIRKDYSWDLSENALGAVSVCLNHKGELIDPPLDEGKLSVFPLVRQNGEYYIYTGADGNSVENNWMTWSGSVVRGNWELLVEGQLEPDSSEFPNFTILGADPEFGYAVRYHIETDDDGIEYNVWIDRLCVNPNETTDPCLCMNRFSVELPAMDPADGDWGYASCPYFEGVHILSWTGESPPSQSTCEYEGPEIYMFESPPGFFVFAVVQLTIVNGNGFSTLRLIQRYKDSGNNVISEPVAFLWRLYEMIDCNGDSIFGLDPGLGTSLSHCQPAETPETLLLSSVP